MPSGLSSSRGSSPRRLLGTGQLPRLSADAMAEWAWQVIVAAFRNVAVSQTSCLVWLKPA